MKIKPNEKGILVVISGPSGVGKGTVCKIIFEHNSTIKFSVSATTRSPRPGEVHGENYFFISKEEFIDKISKNAFLEYMEVFGSNFYGTPREYVEQQLEMGYDVILEIDVNGAMNVKEAYPNAVTVFIAPPSMGELKTRLIGRGTETEDAIIRRTNEAIAEMKRLPEYDYVVVNDSLEQAVSAVESIIHSERFRTIRRDDLDTIYT